MLSETFQCSRCHAQLTFTGESKLELLTQLKVHQKQCTVQGAHPSLRHPKPKRACIWGRLFKRKHRMPVSLPQISIEQREALLYKLEELDQQAIAFLEATPPPDPLKEALKKEAPSSPNPPEAIPSSSLALHPTTIQPLIQTIRQEGFDFEKKTIIKNMNDFRKIREYFLQMDHFTALEELYIIFRASYIDEYGGYGLKAHQKELFMEMTSDVHDIFTLLKGESRPNKDQADLVRLLELDLFRNLQDAIDMASMETLSQREADKQERLLELARAYIAQQEDEKGLKDLLAEDNLVKKEGE